MDLTLARSAVVGSAIIISVFVSLMALGVRVKWKSRPAVPRAGRCHTLYLLPVWGLCNRLRAIRGAYDLAQALGCRLVVLDVPGPTFKPPMLREMLSMPGVIWDDGWIPPGVPIVRSNSGTHCTVRLPLLAFRELAAQHPAIALEACGVDAYGIPENPKAAVYEGLRLLPLAATACEPVLKKLREAPGETIGVHIRHGAPIDYKLKNFFGFWPEHGDDPERTHVPKACCWSASEKSTDSCPKEFTPMEDFLKAMRDAPDDATFFVCSDRPGCLDALRDEFGDRMVTTDPKVLGRHDGSDSLGALAEWYCLSQCDRILTSLFSSFGREAAYVRGIPCVRPG
jgi:hypothetical protein